MNTFKIHPKDEKTGQPRNCHGCRDSMQAPIDIAFAFQPIVDVNSKSIFACEALVRGPRGEPA